MGNWNRKFTRNTRVRKQKGDRANYLKWSLQGEITTTEKDDLYDVEHTSTVVTSSYFGPDLEQEKSRKKGEEIEKNDFREED